MNICDMEFITIRQIFMSQDIKIRQNDLFVKTIWESTRWSTWQIVNICGNLKRPIPTDKDLITFPWEKRDIKIEIEHAREMEGEIVKKFNLPY